MKGNFICKEKYNLIKKYFNSTLSLVKLAKKFSCDYRTIRRVFAKEFGEENVKNRCIKIQNAYIKLSCSDRHKIENTRPEIYKKINKLFYTEKSLKSIGNIFNISPATVANAWKRTFGEDEYKKRVIRMKKVQQKTSSKSFKKASNVGSKNEILCFELLKDKLDYNIIHHDHSIIFNLEIDISIPQKKIAIAWDGIGHRKPIFGEYALSKTKSNDKIKDKILREKNWKYICIIDNGGHNPKFVENKVNEIINLIDKEWEGKVEI